MSETLLSVSYRGKKMSVKGMLEDIKTKAKRRAVRALKIAGTRMANEIKILTPVDTGNTAANWTLGLNGYKEPYDELLDDWYTPFDISALRGMREGDKITIHNSASWIQLLENGYSRQAPAGMVRISLMKWKTFLREAIAEVRAGG